MPDKPIFAPEDLGKPIPNCEHAVSVCLPRWEDNVGYEEGDSRVVETMESGYPRFFVHPVVARLFGECESRFAVADECCMALPSRRAAERCVDFIHQQSREQCRIQEFGTAGVYVVCLPIAARATATDYWQHTGEIISSRLAAALLAGQPTNDPAIEQKRLLRERIAAQTKSNPEDVYLYPNGMAAVFAAYRVFQRFRPGRPSIQFGFPYVDILKIQQKFSDAAPSADVTGAVAGRPVGSGVHFFPEGSEEDLERTKQAADAEEIMALFCEIPGNPLLTSPDLARLDQLATTHGFPMLVDDTLGAFVNINALPVADVLATSLTKFFSGRCDVMGGSLLLNPARPFYAELKAVLEEEYEDLFYAEDAVVLEENSRDFVKRVKQINGTAETVCDYLSRHPAVARIDYPKYRSVENYRAFLQPGGGYGGLFSMQLHKPDRTAPAFYDALEVSKGPNLGTNFTLCCPYTILAHYHELDFVERCGISQYLVRVSIGLEDPDWLIARFRDALDRATGR